jgi:polysaccharide export outer membrane protein
MKSYLITSMAALFLVGCSTFSGSYVSTTNKQSAETQEEVDFDDQVIIYPLTLNTVVNHRPRQHVGVANPELEQQRLDYIYRIGAGDVLNVVVYDHPELTTPAGTYRSAKDSGNWVSQDGFIFYPYIGRIQVLGKTVREVQADITQRLKKYIERPQVSVNVADFKSQRIYMTGEIKDSGTLFLTNTPMTLLDAINQSGGLDKDADWRHVTLTRSGVKQEISLHALMQHGDLTQNQLLQAGDIIHVPRNDDQKVFVMGEVKQNKLLKMDRSGMRLTEALSLAGGLDQMAADATGVFVIRKQAQADSTQPSVQVYQLNVADATALIIGAEFELQPYDLVYVTAAPWARWNRVLKQVLPTLTGMSTVANTTETIVGLTQ